MKINALGFIEVQGLVSAIVAADAMVKAANVRLIKQHDMPPGMVTVIVEGDVAACRAAIDAGIAAAERLGPVISRLEIPRPTSDTEDFVLTYLDSASSLGNAPLGKDNQDKSAKAKESDATKEKQSAIKSTKNDTVNDKTTNDEAAEIAQFSDEALINYIKKQKKGVTFRELLDQFSVNDEDLEKALDGLLKNQTIIFKQMRYSINQ